MMETLGRRPAIAGGSDAMGSSRYSFRSSSLIGTDAQKYEKVLLSGIISPRKRSANWPTLTLERSGCAAIWWVSFQSHFIMARERGLRALVAGGWLLARGQVGLVRTEAQAFVRADLSP